MPVTSLLMSSLSSGGGGGSSPGQALANVGGGLVSGITGYFQKRKAKQLLKEAGEQPLYQIPQEILRNQKMAEQAAQEGLPSQQYSNAMKNIQRSQANALTGALDRRSALMALPRIQQQSNDAYANLDVADANARMQNQKTLYGIGAQTAQYRDKAYQLNELQPWQRKYEYAQNLLGAGNQNFTSGLEKIIGGTGLLIGGNGNNNGLIGGSSGSGSNTKRIKNNSGDPIYYNGYDPSTPNPYGSGFITGFE